MLGKIFWPPNEPSWWIRKKLESMKVSDGKCGFQIVVRVKGLLRFYMKILYFMAF